MQTVVREWLTRLAAALGPKYAVNESKHFHFLSTLQGARSDSALKYLEETRAAILSVLGPRLSLADTVGKHVMLRFAGKADYYRYVADFGPDGESATSGGMCIRGPYIHIATFEQVDPAENASVIAHELAHDLTFALPMPLWLNDALAMFFEVEIAGGNSRQLPGDLVGEHRKYWSAETIQGFWKGDSFQSVDGQRVSYSLAEILFRLIRTDVGPSPDALQRFVLAADVNDAGQSAACDYLGIGLGDLASSFLGPGDWRPKPELWKAATGSGSPGNSIGVPDENGIIWPEGMEPEPESK